MYDPSEVGQSGKAIPASSPVTTPPVMRTRSVAAAAVIPNRPCQSTSGAGTYHWSVQAVDHSFKGSAFADAASFTINARAEQSPGDIETGEDNDLPLRYALYDNYPNPFRTTTTLTYDLPEQATVNITIYNLLGQAVTTIRSGIQEAGRWHLTWDGRDALGRRLGAGVYLVRLQAGRRTFTQKMLLVN